MTQIDPTAISPEDIDDLSDATPATSRSAENASSRVNARLRDSVREDIDHGREWMRSQCSRTEAAIREKPLESTLWALGAGVIIGILIAR